METEIIDYYVPLRNQASKIMTAFIPVLIFSIIMLIWGKNTAAFGLLEYWLNKPDVIPNDYKLLFWGSLISCIILFFQLFSTKIIDKSEKPLIYYFLSGFFGIIPVICNLFLLIFILYLLIFRGIWSLSDLRHGFAFYPLLKFVVFTSLGVYGYISFTHLYMLKRFIKLGKNEEASYYVLRYKLYKL